jgi:hypothetical protein
MQEDNAFMQEAYRQYIKVIEQVAQESQMRCEKAQRDYTAAVTKACEANESEQCLEDAFRNYMRAILEAWSAEEAEQQTLKAHLEYVKEACGPAASQLNFDERRSSYERTLRDALSPEIAPQCLDAYREYVQALKNVAERLQQHAEGA